MAVWAHVLISLLLALLAGISSLAQETGLRRHNSTISVAFSVQPDRPSRVTTRHVRSAPQALLTSDNRDKRGFDAEEKRRLVDKHNVLRRQERASDMSFMIWDTDLEDLAQEWAENCDFSHRPNRKNVGKFAYAGENLFAGTGDYDPLHAVQLWYDEIEFYNYNTMACRPGEMCGHYTQIVWATSLAVGCGVKYCPELRNVDFGQGWHIACNYGPGGNYVRRRPYRKGNVCTECKDDFCVNGLCSKFPVIEA